jgi:uncharacterized YigZ family protein
MRTILVSSTASLIIDKSRFIGVTFHVADTSQVDEHLKEIRRLYPKAKHYCYAYIIDGEEKGFDDQEPAKTAGKPILEVLKRGEYNELLLIVVRYFGGTLLGASRLLRTYVEVASASLAQAEKYEIANLFAYQVVVTYSEYDTLLSEAKKRGYILEKSIFGDKIDIKLLSKERADNALAEIMRGQGKIMPLAMQKRYLKEI